MCQNRQPNRGPEDMTEDTVSRHMNQCLINYETEQVPENLTKLWGMRHHMWQNTWLLSRAHNDEHLTPTCDQAYEHTSLTHQLITGMCAPADCQAMFSGYVCWSYLDKPTHVKHAANTSQCILQTCPLLGHYTCFTYISHDPFQQINALGPSFKQKFPTKKPTFATIDIRFRNEKNTFFWQ